MRPLSKVETRRNLLTTPSFAFENSVSLWRDRLMIVTIRETVVTDSGSTNCKAAVFDETYSTLTAV